jgi:hypothetical protein
LRLVADIPQVIITFDEQKGDDLFFTVILVRVRSPEARDVQEAFAQGGSVLKYIPDRVRKVGHLRKKYLKEAVVFRTCVKSDPFLRKDSSIDMYQARRFIFLELCKQLGEVRDYNGGMIYKQNELLSSLKQALGSLGEEHSLLLEKFYYSLNPIEMRTSVDVDHLKQLFLLLLQSIKTGGIAQRKSGDFLYRQDVKRVMAVIPLDLRKLRIIEERMQGLAIPLHQLVSFSLEVEAMQYAGYLVFTEEKDLQTRFLCLFE